MIIRVCASDYLEKLLKSCQPLVRKRYLWSNIQNIFVASSGHSASLFQDERHRSSFVQESQLKNTI